MGASDKSVIRAKEDELKMKMKAIEEKEAVIEDLKENIGDEELVKQKLDVFENKLEGMMRAQAVGMAVTVALELLSLECTSSCLARSERRSRRRGRFIWHTASCLCMHSSCRVCVSYFL